VGGESLLKTLEEPAPATVLFLTAISESRVLNTLVSRCVKFRVPPLARELVLAAVEEKVGLTGPRAELLAGLSGGALGAALNLDPEESWKSWTNLDMVLGLGLGVGAAGIKASADWSANVLTEIEKFRKLDAEESKKGAEENSQLGESQGGQRRAYFTSLVSFLRLWWRDTVVLAATGDRQKRQGPPPSPVPRKWAAPMDLKDSGFYLKAIDRLEDNLNRFIRPELVLTDYWLSVLTRHNSGNQSLNKPK
jgi:hypothetical protein